MPPTLTPPSPPPALPDGQALVLCLPKKGNHGPVRWSLRQFINELRRRGVLKAGGIYLATAWVVLQVADVTLRPLGMPDYMFSLMIWLVIFGFPFTLAFTWRYDISLDGISLTAPPTRAETRDLRVRKRDFTALALIALLLGVLTYYMAGLLREQHVELLQATPAPVSASVHSIAVLPFDNLGGDTDNYLGLGLAEDILHRLVSIPEMQVASRTASFQLDRSNLDMREIGRRLNVRNVLEGSVRREGDHVRIVAQLIDTETNHHLWSSRYDRRIEDLFQIYDEISTALATELQLTLAPDSRLIMPPPTVDMRAYDFFLQARSILQRASQADNVANAQRFFANAVEIDPDFAEAWAGQCRAWLEWYEFEASHDKIQAAEHSCRRALELNPGLADSHVALGDLFRIIGAYDQAVDQYQAAFNTAPKLAIGWRGIGLAFHELGREPEAESALVKAIEYDPDDLLNLRAFGNFLMDHGRFGEARPVFERMARHPRAGVSTFNDVGYALGMLGDFDGAAEAFRQVVAMDPTSAAYSNVGVMYYLHGSFDAAVVMLREAIGLAPEDPINWSNLGDALRETPGGAAESLEAYRKGVELSENMLDVNASDPVILTNLAHCLSRLGDHERATELMRGVLKAAPEDPYAHYYTSLVHLEAGRLVPALEAITRAVDLNFPVLQLQNDPQFDTLRGNETFERLLARPAGDTASG